MIISIKAKEKERRLRLREQKLVEQRQHQEDRLKRALERSQADPKKRVNRHFVQRVLMMMICLYRLVVSLFIALSHQF